MSITKLLTLLSVISGMHMFALEGRFEFELNEVNSYFAIPNRGYYNQTEIKAKITCKPGTKVRIGWLLRYSECVNEFYLNANRLPAGIYAKIYQQPNIVLQNYPFVEYLKPTMKEYTCDETLGIIDLFSADDLHYITEKTNSFGNQPDNHVNLKKRQVNYVPRNPPIPTTKTNTNKTDFVKHASHNHKDIECIARTWKEGSYLFVFNTQRVNPKDTYSIDVTITLEHNNGLLSANDWPFLPFFAVMCAIYSVYGIFWLVCSCVYWRDMLKLQLWIGGVIVLGLMEKAAYLAEYESINKTGQTVKFAMITAEVISCFKRSLARMLVVIVSLGFGIVKPRLGPTMQKVVGLGSLYFVLAIIDGIFRIVGRKEDNDNKGVLAGVPLVVIDVTICYWILCNLQQTMRTLKVRRNIPKLSLYRHFTNTLIFAVIASVVFMAWSLKRHRFVECLKGWQELWLDEGFWHMLFSFILLVIIILWRPSKNSQRFAFTPLLDNEEDADEDDAENQETEIFDSIKMRQKPGKKDRMSAEQENQKSFEDDLKWVEDNVPATLIETVVPAMIDSEEELMTTKFETSKMD